MWWAREVNPMCGDCFASFAICCCFVDTGSSSDALAMFPPNKSVTQRPLPSPGSGRIAVPLLHRYYGTLRRPAARPAALRFLRLAVPFLASVFVSPAWPGAGQEAWSFWEWQPHAT